MGIPYPQAAAKTSGLTELAGGVALAAGIMTRPIALAVAFNMGIAVWKAHWKNGFYGQGGYEFPLLLGTSAMTLALTGPGAVSIDGIVS
jgi:putative oxidoreductase